MEDPEVALVEAQEFAVVEALAEAQAAVLAVAASGRQEALPAVTLLCAHSNSRNLRIFQCREHRL